LGESLRYDIHIAKPKNANGRGNLTKEGGLERFIKYAWKEPDCAAILILIDAENECPIDIATELSKRVEVMGILFPVVIVVANHMYECWFLASIETIAGHLGLPTDVESPADVEAIGNPKAWINQRLPHGRVYKETQDQEAMTHLLDMGLAKRSRSFQRLLHAVDQAVQAIDANANIVTPAFA